MTRCVFTLLVNRYGHTLNLFYVLIFQDFLKIYLQFVCIVSKLILHLEKETKQTSGVADSDAITPMTLVALHTKAPMEVTLSTEARESS